MSDQEDFDLDAMIKAAASFSPDQLNKFVLSLPEATRLLFLKRLEGLRGSNPGIENALGPTGSPTVIIEPTGQSLKRNPTIIDHEMGPSGSEQVGPLQRSSKTLIDETPGATPLKAKFTIADDDAQGSASKVADDGLTFPKTINDEGPRDDAGLRTPQTIVSDGPDTGESYGRRSGDGGSGLFLVKLHARGAVGEVFVAYEEQLSREVAIKRIRPELPYSEKRVQRFIREAEITAKLQHPGIVPIYKVDLAGNSPHYTMPLVSGSTLSDLITDTHRELGSRSNREAWVTKLRPLLTHFIAACNAIDYAHSQRVLHRDLKPSNIIVGTQGQTLVLDWGCAKNIGDPETDKGSVDEFQSNDGEAHAEAELLAKVFGTIEESGTREDIGDSLVGQDITVSGSVMGTIEFMSPEQASGDANRVGPATDIFGLGATLFSILTNDVALKLTKEDGVKSAIDRIKRGDIRRVNEVDSRVPLPLAAICQRAMEFEPERRYRSAGELGREVDAFLAGEVVGAYHEPLPDRVKRFIRRHQTLAAALVATALVGFVSLLLVALMINQQRGKLALKNEELASLNGRLASSVETEQRLLNAAVDREAAVERQLYETEMLLASEASTLAGGIGRMRRLTANWADEKFDSYRGWEWYHLENLGRRELWKLDLDTTANQIIFSRGNPDARVFDAGKSLLTTISVANHQVIDQTQLPTNATAVDFRADPSLLAVGCDDGKVMVAESFDPNVEPIELKGLTSKVTDIRWNVGGDYLAACDAGGKLVVWKWPERRIEATGQNVINQSDKRLLSWSYDGKQVCWTTGPEIRSLTVETSKEKTIARDDWIANPCWSHEGKLLAYIGPENSIVVTDPVKKTTHRFEGHQLFVESLAWHPNSHFLLSASADGTVRIWDTDTNKQARQLLGHVGHVYSAAWSSDGKKVLSGGLPEDSLRAWNVADLASKTLDRELQDRPAVAWLPDGDQLAVAEDNDILIQSNDGKAKWIRGRRSQLASIFGLDVDSSGTRIACVSGTGRVWTIDIASSKVTKVYDVGSEQEQYPQITSKGVAWSPDGKHLAGVGAGGKVRVWDVAKGIDLMEEIDVAGQTLVVAWQPHSSDRTTAQLACAGTGDHISVFDPEKQKIVSEITQYGWKTGIAWSPDGRLLAASDRRDVSIWNTKSQKLVAKCEGPSAMILDVAWSKSQDRIAALTENGKICIWNSKTWEYTAKFGLHDRVPYELRWSPDGNRLVSTARFGRVVFQDIDK